MYGQYTEVSCVGTCVVAQRRGRGFRPLWLGRTTPGQLSPCSREPVLGSTRSLCHEKPGRHDERIALARCIQRKAACSKEDPHLKEDPQLI